MSRENLNIMLDSGAYTAWVKGVKINLREYVSFIKKFEHVLHSYVSLDVIPGKPDTSPSQGDVEESAKQGLKNFEYMRSAGLKPIPVFHYGEKPYYLEKYANECDYIGLGSSGYMRSHDLRIEGFDMAFTMLTHRNGTPKVKTHGFAVMSPELITRYPWTSCDATSWIVSAGHGTIQVPQWDYKIDEYDYSVSPLQVIVSEREDRLNIEHSLNILGPECRKYVLNYFESVNTTQDKLCKRSERVRINSMYFLEIEKRHSTSKFSFRRSYLFNGHDVTSDRYTPHKFSIFLAGEDLRSLSKHHSNVLVSFYDLRMMSSMNLQTFVDLEEAKMSDK